LIFSISVEIKEVLHSFIAFCLSPSLKLLTNKNLTIFWTLETKILLEYMQQTWKNIKGSTEVCYFGDIL